MNCADIIGLSLIRVHQHEYPIDSLEIRVISLYFRNGVRYLMELGIWLIVTPNLKRTFFKFYERELFK